MKKIQASSFIKLGTALRYLIDAKNSKEKVFLGDPYILVNIEKVITLIRELEFNETMRQGVFQQLIRIEAELKKDILKDPYLSEEHAKQLETICRELRVLLLQEGNTKEVFCLSAVEKEKIMSQHPEQDPWSLFIRLLRDNRWIVVFLIILSFLILILIANGLIKIPNILEPTSTSTGRETEPTSEPPPVPEKKVTVNLFCSWNSQGKLNQSINSATVSVKSVRIGDSIIALGGNIDTEKRISFEIDRTDIVEVTIGHPDIRDSQLKIPNIKITETDQKLRELKFTVPRYNCFLPSK
ncbi:MAG: hypothetical protein HC851_10755 [Acaryochloris sp. RU_4_1]|nr:hypothetical protein [Acaryochloris sp. RU_4_1]NJR54632.1 hypothetical protein [Acaryochloris sp. CRU_2_0]